MITIAVDALGGDHAPHEIVRGAAVCVRTAMSGASPIKIILVGDEERIADEVAKTEAAEGLGELLTIVDAPQTIAMDEHPTDAVKSKPDSSLVKAILLAKTGQADGVYSAGNTGAMMVGCIQILDRVPGVRRPPIATFLPTETGGRCLLVDAGANVDCRSSQLLQFAQLGSIYAQKTLGILNPRVGLLSNGEEEGKGDELTRETATLLADQAGLNYVGYVEGNHVFENRCDVVVCDGFVGNVLLKGAEGTVRMALSLLAADARKVSNAADRDALLHSLIRVGQRVDYSEMGGAPLLGVNGVAFIGHGRSDARAIASGIRMAALAAESGYVAAVRDAFAQATQG